MSVLIDTSVWSDHFRRRNDILAELREAGEDPARNADDMRGLFEKTVLLANKKRLNAAKVLMIDETSMLDGVTLSSVETNLRTRRQKNHARRRRR